eukprot:4203326-Pyramimonas_sp.AAC.1
MEVVWQSYGGDVGGLMIMCVGGVVIIRRRYNGDRWRWSDVHMVVVWRSYGGGVMFIRWWHDVHTVV